MQKKVTNNVGVVSYLRKYVYDGQEIIAELDENDNTLVRYTHSGQRTDDVLSMDVTSHGVSKGIAPSTGSYFFLKDGLGSIIDITNSSGNIVQHYVYSSFGKILKIDNSGVDNTQNPLIKTNFAYTNREFDSESGLYYYRARYYDAHSGRFMQEDPDPGFTDFTVTLNNKYVYGANNPMLYTDPSGEVIGIDDVLIAMVISAAINAVIASAQQKGNFFENLMSWEVAGKAAFKAAIGTGLVIGGGYAGSLLAGGAGAVIGGALGGIIGTWGTSSALGETASASDYLFAGLFGALGGGFVHIQRVGSFATQGSRVGLGISDLNRGTVEGLINNPKPAPIKPIKVPRPM